MFGLIPLPYKLLGLAIMAAVIFGTGWVEGAGHERDRNTRAALAAAKEAAIRQAARESATNEADKKGVAEGVRIRTVYKTITKEIPIYVSQIADSECVIPVGFVLLHNAAASGSVPESSGQPNDTPSGVELSGVAKIVTENYGTCIENSTRLSGLQQWVNEQSKVK